MDTCRYRLHLLLGKGPIGLRLGKTKEEKKMPKKSNQHKRFTLNVELVARKTNPNDVGKVQVRISSLNLLGLKTHRTTIWIQNSKNHNNTPQRPPPGPHPKKTIQKLFSPRL